MVIKEPGLYRPQFDIEPSASIHALAIGFLLSSALYIIINQLSHFLNYFFNSSHITHFTFGKTFMAISYWTPLLTYAILDISSSKYTQCMICTKNEKLGNINEYLDVPLSNKKCFCCSGSGKLVKKEEKGRLHQQLVKTIKQHQLHKSKLTKLLKEKAQILSFIKNNKTVFLVIDANSKTELESLTEQIDFTQTSETFYKTVAIKMMKLIYNESMLQYISSKEQELSYNLIQNKFSTYTNIHSFEKSIDLNKSFLVDEIEVLSQKIKLTHEHTITNELKEEIKMITDKLNSLD
ncbi:hypothetical protein V6R21_13230 [Limibacter armeniacum]|uniref:hypothetical protein n=1 Tax=Limibacter armeniacum TaxID=466084 RepID=UPI002FE5151E